MAEETATRNASRRASVPPWAKTPEELADRSRGVLVELHDYTVAYVDECDADLVLRFKWTRFRAERTSYALARIGTAKVWMHRLLMGVDGPIVDHIDGDGLNNRRANLRHATSSQNVVNSVRQLGASGFRGVDRRPSGRYRASIYKDGRKVSLGQYATAEEASAVYEAEAVRLWGEFAVSRAIRERAAHG